MQHKIINGNLQSQILRDKIKIEVSALHFKPKLSVILVGEDAASQIYVRIKTRRAQEVGIDTEVHRFNESLTNAELLGCIDKLNKDESVHGILVQMPLPKHIDHNSVLKSISPIKDVDGFSPFNVGCLHSNNPSFVPCTPLGIIHLIKSVRNNLAGLKAIIIGRSNIVGRPVAELLLQEDCTITIAHSKSRDISNECVRNDIIVVAAGQPKLVNRQFVKEGAIVIDVGINKINDQLVGDVDFNDVIEKVAYITPVPGGVGPMTVSYLLANTLRAAKLAFES